MAFCSNCGNKLKLGTKFCPKCGHGTGVSYVSKDYIEKEPIHNTGISGIWVVLVLIIALCVGCFAFSKCSKQKQAEIQKEKEIKEAQYRRMIGNGGGHFTNSEGDYNRRENTTSPERTYSQNKSNSNGLSNPQYRQRPFIDGQDIMARIYHQRFVHSNGLEIRIDGYGRIEIDGDPAGILSVLNYNSESAMLRYGNGLYGEGKIILMISGDKLLLKDPVDGAIFYQR